MVIELVAAVEIKVYGEIRYLRNTFFKSSPEDIFIDFCLFVCFFEREREKRARGT